MSRKIACLVLYAPVIHQGYIQLLRNHADSVNLIAIVGTELLEQVGYKEKEIRAISPETAKSLIEHLVSTDVSILTPENINSIDLGFKTIRLVEDDVTRVICERYWPERQDIWRISAFLRWDSTRVFSQDPTEYDRISETVEDNGFLRLAQEVSQRTSDWWRQVGAVLVKNGQVVDVVYNRHLPSEHTPYVLGDPRDFVKAGERSELASAIHCEQQIIANAARSAYSLEGTSLYIPIFPCPVCAKMIALSGIKKCYFWSGHASLDGRTIMKTFNVELILVKKTPDYQPW
jgi:dCMP deaminase